MTIRRAPRFCHHCHRFYWWRSGRPRAEVLTPGSVVTSSGWCPQSEFLNELGAMLREFHRDDPPITVNRGGIMWPGAHDPHGAPLDLTGGTAPSQYAELFETGDVLIFDPNGLRSLRS